MPRILVTRFPDSANAADASQLGFGPAGYNGLLYDAGLSPSACGFMDALSALKHGGPHDLALVELCDKATADVIGRYTRYLRIFEERARDAGSDCELIPIITHDGLLDQSLRDTMKARCTYAFMKPLPSKARFTDDLGTLIQARKGTGAPYLRIPNPPQKLEEYIIQKLNIPAPLKPNHPYDTAKHVVYREQYLGFVTRDESIQFFPKGDLMESTIEVLALKLGTEFAQLANGGTKPIPVELHLR